MSLSTKETGDSSKREQALPVSASNRRKTRGAGLPGVVTLALFFVSMMSDFLVERQSDSISILRSRGASRSQLFGAFTVQGIALGLVALIAGPLLATALVSLVLLPQLSSQNASALALLAGNPQAIFLNLGGFALITVVASIIAMVVSIYRAMQVDVLAMRREAARAGSIAFTDSQHPVIGADDHLYHILAAGRVLWRAALAAGPACHHLYQRQHNRGDK